MIEFSCKSCGKKYQVKDSMAGVSGTCKQCGTSIEVPEIPPEIRKCPYCAEVIQTDAVKCKHCGEWIDQTTGDLLKKSVVHYSKIQAPWRLVVLSMATFGLYNLYWFYRNWRDLKQRNNLSVRPVWRTIGLLVPILNLVYIYDQFKDVRKYAEEVGVKAYSSPGWMTCGFCFVSGISFRLSRYEWRTNDPKELLGLTVAGLVFDLLAVCFLIVIQNALNSYWERVEPSFFTRRGFSRLEIGFLAIGAVLWMLNIVGLALPEDQIADSEESQEIVLTTSETQKEVIAPDVGSIPAVIRKIEPAVVSISTYDEENQPLGEGTGFFINKAAEIITNRHVLEQASRAEVRTKNAETYRIRNIVAEDIEGDLVRTVLENPPKNVTWLPINSQARTKGQKVLVLGNPFGLEQTVSDGLISAIRDIPDFGPIIQITAPISPGSSGSPVVNLRGELLAVATAGFVEGQNLNFAIPAERILALTPIADGPLSVSDWNEKQILDWMETEEGLLTAAYIFADEEDYENVLIYTQKALQLNSTSAEALYFRGVAYDGQKLYQEAIQSYQDALSIRPDYASALFGLGGIYGILGRYREASESFRKGLLAEPDRSDGYFGLGIIFYRCGQYEEAIQEFTRAVQMDPEDTDYHFWLGIAHLKNGDRNSALQEYKMIQELDYEAAETLFNAIYE